MTLTTPVDRIKARHFDWGHLPNGGLIGMHDDHGIYQQQITASFPLRFIGLLDCYVHRAAQRPIARPQAIGRHFCLAQLIERTEVGEWK